MTEQMFLANEFYVIVVERLDHELVHAGRQGTLHDLSFSVGGAADNIGTVVWSEAKAGLNEPVDFSGDSWPVHPWHAEVK